MTVTFSPLDTVFFSEMTVYIDRSQLPQRQRETDVIMMLSLLI